MQAKVACNQTRTLPQTPRPKMLALPPPSTPATCGGVGLATNGAGVAMPTVSPTAFANWPRCKEASETPPPSAFAAFTAAAAPAAAAMACPGLTERHVPHAGSCTAGVTQPQLLGELPQVMYTDLKGTAHCQELHTAKNETTHQPRSPCFNDSRTPVHPAPRGSAR